MLSQKEFDGFKRKDAAALASIGAYVRVIRGSMALGLPPLPGTRVEWVSAGGCPAVWLTPGGTSWAAEAAPRRTVMWLHGGAFIPCSTATHARLLSSVGAAADARVLSVEYSLGPDQVGTYV